MAGNSGIYDILIRDATIVDGTGAAARKGSIAVRGGKIVRIGFDDGASGSASGTPSAGGPQGGSAAKGGMADGTPAARVIDGTGLIACPGFIDVHNHADLFLLDDSGMDILVRQGVTTFSGGHCGLGPAPVGRGEYAAALRDSFGVRSAVDYDTFGEWLARVEAKGLVINFVPFCGHGAIRGAVLGNDYYRPSTEAETAGIRDRAEEALESGAFGISTGYDGIWPGTFADRREQVTVAKAAARYGAIYTCHTRHHQYGWAAADTPAESGYGVFHGPAGEAFFGRYHGQLEALDVAREAGARLHIAHLSTPYLVHQPHPARLDEELARAALEEIVDRNRALGMDVSFNVIPNIESIATESPVIGWFLKAVPSCTEGEFIRSLDSAEFRERLRNVFLSGRMKFAWIHPLVDPYWFDCFIVVSSGEASHRGRLVGDILREKRKKGWTDFVYGESFDLLLDFLRNDPEATWAPILDKRQLGYKTFLKHPCGMAASDLIIPRAAVNSGSPYGVSPYTTNLFPDLIRRLIREEGIMSLEEGIRKITGLPAEYLFRLPDRGVLREGNWADIVLFSLAEIGGRADFADPLRPPAGMAFVMVNGTIVVENTVIPGGTPGCILKRT